MQLVSAEWFRKLKLLPPAPYRPWHHALRISSGTGLPLLVGVTTGNIAPWLFVALGAFLTEMTTRLGPYPERFRMIAISTAISTTGCLIGPVIAHHGPVTFLVLMLVGFLSGVISSYGAAISTGALYMLVLAIVHASTADSIAPWAVGLCFMSGAAFVTAMLALGAIADRNRPERVLRASLLRALAALASAGSQSATETARRAVTEQTKQAYAMLIEKRSHNAGRTRDNARSADMLSLSNQLMMSIIAARDDPAARNAAAAALEAMAQAHEAGKPLPPVAGDGTLARLCRQLSDRLGETKQPEQTAAAAVPRKTPLSASAALRKTARKLVVGREVVISSLRLAFCIGLAEIAGEIVSGDHAYWVPMTIAIIMKPDFGSVFTRAIHRSIGTVIGVLIAMAALALIPDKIGLVAAIAVLAAIQPFVALRSYAVKVMFLTPVVLMMIEIAVPAPPLHYGLQRLADTLIGGVIVLVFGYLIWPRSQNVKLASAFRTSLDAVAAFLSQATNTNARSGTPSLGEAEFSAYRKLSDMRTQLQKLSAEPPPAGREAARWFPAVVGAERLCDAIAAYAEGQGPGAPPPDPERIAQAQRTMAALAPGALQPAAQEQLDDPFAAVETEIAWLTRYLHELPADDNAPLAAMPPTGTGRSSATKAHPDH